MPEASIAVGLAIILVTWITAGVLIYKALKAERLKRMKASR